MNSEIEITLEKQGDVTIFDMKGDVTSFSEPIITEAYHKAIEQDTRKLLLKFYESAYINSGGIAVLIQLLAKTKRNNQKICMTGLSAHMQKIFNMVGVTKFTRIYNTAEEAMEELRC